MTVESELAKLIGVMAAAYPNTKMADANIEVYVMMLKDLPLDLVQMSVQQCMAESEFLPTVARLRNKVYDMTALREPEPLEAWGIVLREIGRTGFYRSPHFDNPIIAKAVECIGWQSLCSSENQVADRAHFAKVYESLRTQAENDRRLLPAARRIQQQVRGLIGEAA